MSDIFDMMMLSALSGENNNISSIGRFLSLWDCSTGLPVTNPTSMPYAYKTGDYFRVSRVAGTYTHTITYSGTTVMDRSFSLQFNFDDLYEDAYTTTMELANALYAAGYDSEESILGATGSCDSETIKGIYSEGNDVKLVNIDDVECDAINGACVVVINDTVSGGLVNYKPTGSSYSGVASSVVESENVNVGWVYYYDGAQWISERSGSTLWGSISGTLSEQSDLQEALSSKVGTSSYNPDTKTSAMTQSVGKDSNGKLWTTPGGNDSNAVHYTADSDKTSEQKAQARTNIGAEAADATILKRANVVNNVTSTTTNLPLSANMGKELQDQVNNLKNIGRFLAIWNSATGMPLTNPVEMPYAYRTGDYYRVGVVSTDTPAVNYMPNGASYTGAASTTVETESVEIGWVYYYDGTQWLAQSAGGGGTVQDVQVNGTTVVDSGTGVANVPVANASTYGVIKIGARESGQSYASGVFTYVAEV